MSTKVCSSYTSRSAGNSAKRWSNMSERQELLATVMERKKALQKEAPVEFYKQIFQEIKVLEEQFVRRRFGSAGQVGTF